MSSEYGVHSNQISKWKQELIEKASSIFGKVVADRSVHQQKITDNLHRIIGEIKVENDSSLKKIKSFDVQQRQLLKRQKR